MTEFPGISRREALQSLGMASAGMALGCGRRGGIWGLHGEIERVVGSTPFVDTHEHLADEVDRLAGRGVPCDDWSLLLYDYVSPDLLSAGMSKKENAQFFSKHADPLQKWEILEPYWPRVKNTGYGRAVQITIQDLYGIGELGAETIPRLQSAYEKLRQPGMYQRILIETANIESCQVNSSRLPFRESTQPHLLMQDLSFQTLHIDPKFEKLSQMAGIRVRSLEDWHRVIRWWFDTYSIYAVAAKSQGAYLRGLNYRQAKPEEAEPVFDRMLSGEKMPRGEKKVVEDHLFWFCVDQATRHRLPVKIHTGYLAVGRQGSFRRVANHFREIVELCRRAPETQFVFLHISYPYWQELITLAKRYANAHAEMSWAWITNPTAAQEFLKQYLVTAPANKVFTFGGDYAVAECVVGHSVMARRGITQALTDLVEEGWLQRQDALDLVEPLLRGNARELFRLEEKSRNLSQAPWI